METADLELWQEYRACERPSSPIRDELILRYAPLVRYVANRMKARLPQTVSVEDLVSCGMFGLIEAIDRFEPEREVKFETYAVARIQGSILDELRAMDWAPRSVRSRVRQVAKARAELEQQLHRMPTAQEIADQLDWTVADVHQVQSESDASYIDQLHGHRDDDEQTPTTLDVPDVAAEDPVLNHEIDMTRNLLAKAIVMLPDRERAIAAMYWRGGRCPTCFGADPNCERCQGAGIVSGLTLAEIGEVIGVSESWVCMTYTSAALGLRDRLAELR